MGLTLRDYQADALRLSKDRFDAGVQRQLIQMPTGTGKTVVFAKLKEHHSFQHRLMVLIHREELAKQAADSIKLWNPSYRVGIEMADREASSNDDIVVASVQTLGLEGSKRLDKFNPAHFDGMVSDEAHHATATTWKRVFNKFGLLEHGGHRGLLLGVTATPNRGDGQALGQVFDEIVYRMSILDAIRDGWLVNIRGFKVRTGVDISGVGSRAGDFAVGQLESAVNIDQRNHLIVQNWLSRCENRQTVAFCVDIAHAQQLAATFQAYGVAAQAVWGSDPDRAEKLAYHKTGRLKVLTNCGVLTEGYDDWTISCIVMARPTKSQLLFVQMAGRGTRIPAGLWNLNEAIMQGLVVAKRDCLIMDVVDNTGRHSLTTLASLFGLGETTDLQGKTVTEAKAIVDEARQMYPDIDLNTLDSLEEIKSTVEHVELFDIKWSEEVLGGSKLKWHKTVNGDYTISLPNNEAVTISQDLLDKWNVKGRVMSNTFEIKGIDSLVDAFNQADNFIQSHGKGLMPLLRREAKWHKKRISMPQKMMLKRLYKYEPQILAHLDSLSSGEASNLIDKKIKGNLAAKAGA